ncbi:3-oxoacyl-ACP synthase [Sphingobacterium endophyticum]|uniref:3-oxoacyl-ACP synthase n=1 Tax=Sphingobacterium endophyticum TaxID=2546448 RepID=UPI0012E2B0E8|nr:3-oxoacyl-ACP synthase [Sphingobacterium endophyticum]
MDWNKDEIVELCMEKCLSRMQDIKSAMDTAQDAIMNDTKSSMGDKYETSREMAQQEISRLQHQLSQAELDIEKLKTLNLKPSQTVMVGSVVETSQFDYFIAISIGPLKINDRTIMVVSKESPIGNILMGKQTSNLINFNGKTLSINRII